MPAGVFMNRAIVPVAVARVARGRSGSGTPIRGATRGAGRTANPAMRTPPAGSRWLAGSRRGGRRSWGCAEPDGSSGGGGAAGPAGGGGAIGGGPVKGGQRGGGWGKDPGPRG